MIETHLTGDSRPWRRNSARRKMPAQLLAGFFLLAASPAAAELVNDPYVLNFGDGAGAVAFNLAANTGTPVVFNLPYGTWNIAFVGKSLEVDLSIDPLTGTDQLQPSFAVSGLDWTPQPGVITGFARDPSSSPNFFDLTVIGIPDSVAASSSTSLAIVNASADPTTLSWRWTIEVDHVPEPRTLSAGLVGILTLSLVCRRSIVASNSSVMCRSSPPAAPAIARSRCRSPLPVASASSPR